MADSMYIEKLKKEKDVVILAHYYVDGEVQKIADYVGDSYYLSKVATETKQGTILFCGVSFMGETAKILNPQKKVIMADKYADCPMAHMVDVERVKQVREQYNDVAVVCYVNSTASIKAVSDVCVTSSNAVKVIKNLPEKNIFFIPDNNLGKYAASCIPEKNFIFHDGFCHVHKSIEKDNVLKAKKLHPDALVLTHPECTEDVIEVSDFVGSTSQIIEYASKSSSKKFIICTEMGIFFELKEKNPDKKFFSVGHRQFCPNMKKITVKKVLAALENPLDFVELPTDIIENASKPLVRMIELAEYGAKV